MAAMTDSEWKAFVSHGTRTGKLATVRADGSPHVVPIWFVVDDDGTLVFNTGKDTAKGKALARDPRVCLCVDDQEPPYAFVSIHGEASISEDPDELLSSATRIAARYMGDDRAEAYGRRNAVPGELVVRVAPQRVIAVGNIAG